MPRSIEPPPDWRNDPSATRDFWQSFVSEAKAAILAVPSIIMPYTTNYLLNPEHRDHDRISIVSATRHFLDRRFMV